MLLRQGGAGPRGAQGLRWWFTCQTCEQEFTGAMRIGLANAWWSKVRDRAEEDPERLAAAHNLALSLSSQGKHAEAEEMQREVLAVRKRVLGAEHPDTLVAACDMLQATRKRAAEGAGACADASKRRKK